MATVEKEKKMILPQKKKIEIHLEVLKKIFSLWKKIALNKLSHTYEIDNR